MFKSLIRLTKMVLPLVALMGLAVVTYGQEQVLTANQDSLTWQGWNIKIRELCFSNFVRKGDGLEYRSDYDSIFVYLLLWATNNTHQGAAFIPQNEIKIIIGENAFDAENLGLAYMNNIEPTLSRMRSCYFELPKALAKNRFIIRFSAPFTKDYSDIEVTITTKGEPLPGGITFRLAPPDHTYKVTKH